MLKHKALIPLFSIIALATSCGRDDLFREEDSTINRPRWVLEDELSPLPGPLQPEDSPLVGDWLGPGNVGDCIDDGSWQRYRSDGSFEQVNFNHNMCLEEDERYVVNCQGGWQPVSLEATYESSGELLYACRAEDTHPSQPQERYVETTFALLNRGEDWQELSTMAWLWQEDGRMRRTYQTELTYPPSPSFPEPERVATLSQTTLTLHEGSEDGPVVSAIEDFEDTLFAGAALDYWLEIEIVASGNFSSFGVSEQGEERFVLPVVVRREDDFLVMRAALEGDSDFLAWSMYLQERDINMRYAVLGGVFMLAYTRTLYLDVRAPAAWAAATPWLRVEDICEWYPADRFATSCGE